jgi:hypothetical protein
VAAPGQGCSVFISHSCKDDETGPVDDSAEAQARWTRLQYARNAREAITDRLQRRGYDVLVDVDELRPGGHWRADLHAWLGICDGAVVLLDQDSVRSDWVRKEATILTWRAQLGSSLTLVPVYLPGFDPRELREAGLDPLRLDDFQAVKADGELSPAALAEFVTEQFAELPLDTVPTPMRRWTREVADMFERVRGPYLGWAAEALGVTDAELAQFSDRHLFLAHHLMHAELRPAIACVKALRSGLHPHELRRLVELVTPIWVSHEAAQHLHAILRSESLTPPLLTAEDWQTGSDYIQRAHCCQLLPQCLVSFPDKFGEEAGDVVRTIERTLAEVAGLSVEQVEENPERLDTFLDDARETLEHPLYALVGPGAVRTDVLSRITQRFGAKLSIVLLGGPATADTADALGATLVRPPLSPEEAEHARHARALVRLASS